MKGLYTYTNITTEKKFVDCANLRFCVVIIVNNIRTLRVLSQSIQQSFS